MMGRRTVGCLLPPLQSRHAAAQEVSAGHAAARNYIPPATVQYVEHWAAATDGIQQPLQWPWCLSVSRVHPSIIDTGYSPLNHSGNPGVK